MIWKEIGEMPRRICMHFAWRQMGAGSGSRHRAHVAQLELETTQRIANRTDALERSVSALRQQATRDPLTGLYNRRILNATLERLAEHCRSAEEPLAVMMIDVDDFKLLNDT